MSQDHTILEAALGYARRGWPVFPVRRDKKPYPGTRGVLEATTDERQIKTWWDLWPEANVALDVGGAGMMVLDLDPGHDLKELEKNVGSIPQTKLSTSTPRGGSHLFFLLSAGECVSPSTSKLAPHVDVRSFHSYILLPPSQTQDGSYVWGANGKPAHRTDEMVRVAAEARDKDPDRDKWIIEPDTSENVARAQSWLQQDAKISIEGQGGDHCTYATAAYLKSLGISQATALELMQAYYNPRCQPPWDDDALEVKVTNAYRYNTSPPGNLTPAYRTAKAKLVFEPRHTNLPEGDETRVGHFRFVDRAGMDCIKPPEWIIKDLLADESYAVIYGKWGTFKTFLALDMALSIACGFPSQPTWEIMKAGPVLFAIGEGRSAFTKRVRGWEALHHHGAMVDGLVLADPVPTTTISEEALAAFIGEALRRHPDGYRAIFIDTLGRAMEGADENSQRDASAMTALAHRLRQELGGSVLALHHSGKDETKGARGSSVIGADADTMLHIVRRGRDRLVKLRMVKQKDAPEWDEPKLLRLYDVNLGLQQENKDRELTMFGMTLAVGPARKEDEAQAQKTKARDQEAVAMEVIDREVRAILEANPLRAWTQRDLAEAVAMREAVDADSKTLAGHTLVRLREDKKTYAHGAYDPVRNRNAGRWRHSG